MVVSKFGSTLENVWADSRRCAARSRVLKASLDRIRLSALALLIASAVFGLLSAQLPEMWNPLRILAFLSAAAAAIGAYVTAQALGMGLEREWVLSRSIAEALRSEAFRYLARVDPYASVDRGENDELLSRRAGEYRDRITLGSFMRLDGERLTEGMPQDWVAMDRYLADRIQPQIDFYERRAEQDARSVRSLAAVTIVLGGVAAVIGAAQGTYQELKGLGAWIAVLTSVSAAITTYLYANRLQFLAQSYEITAARLRRSVEAWERVPEPDRAARTGEFIARFEDILLVENKQWVAEFDKSSLDGGSGKTPPAEPR